MLYLQALIMLLVLAAPLAWIARRHHQGRAVRSQLMLQIFTFFAVGLAFNVLGFNNAFAAETTEAVNAISDVTGGMIAAALATGLSGIGGGIATAAAASAALGAISENEKVFGKAILFVGLAEGIALYGLIISFMILGKF